MNGRRFTVRWAENRGRGFAVMVAGWAVYDGDERITITWPDCEEALRHRDNIAKLYARWGFV